MSARAAVMLALVLAASAATAEPRLPAPTGCQVGVMGERMSFNGVPMRLRQLRCPYDIERVLDHYRRLWPAGSRDRPGYTLSRALAPWTILTRAADGWLMTVQVTGEAGHTVGYLVVSRLVDPDELPARGEGFPRRRDARVVNEVTSDDPGQRGRTLQLHSRAPMSSNVIFYRNWYRDRGWTVAMDRQVGPRLHALAFRNGRESVNVAIVDGDGGSVITAQIVEHALW